MDREVYQVDSSQERGSCFRLFQLIVLLAWITGFWLLGASFGGTPLLGKFLRPDYWWIVKMGTTVLVLFLIALVVCEPHDRGRRGVALLLQMGIMIVPLLYLPTAVSSNLSPEAAKKRSLSVAGCGLPLESVSSRQSSGSVSAEGKAEPQEPKLLVNPPLIDLLRQSERYDGKPVTTLGRVCLDDRLPQGTFFCYRLLMVCCAADVVPIGVLVDYGKIKTLQNGGWVKVSGTVGLTTFESHRAVKIVAQRVEPTTPPKDPYVWP